MEEFIDVIERLLATEDDTGCTWDEDDPDSFRPTVVDKNVLNELRELTKHYQLGS